MPEKFESTTISSHFGFLFEKARAGISHDYRDVIVFEKDRFENVYRPR